MLISIILLFFIISNNVNGNFPSSFGSCGSMPPLPSSENYPSLNSSTLGIKEALKSVDVFLELLTTRGIDLVESGLMTTPTVALSVGVILDQELIWDQHYGLRNISDSSTKPTKDSIYRIGSISKIFTLLATMDARDRGILSLDDAINKYIPEFSLKALPFPKQKALPSEITFGQLCSHLGGLTRESPCYGQPDDLVFCDMNDETAFARIANTTGNLRIFIYFTHNTMHYFYLFLFLLR